MALCVLLPALRLALVPVFTELLRHAAFQTAMASASSRFDVDARSTAAA